MSNTAARANSYFMPCGQCSTKDLIKTENFSAQVDTNKKIKIAYRRRKYPQIMSQQLSKNVKVKLALFLFSIYVYVSVRM